jgi:hypothetical protein
MPHANQQSPDFRTALTQFFVIPHLSHRLGFAPQFTSSPTAGRQLRFDAN